LSDLNATITDVVVNFKRNKFPQISDSGSADILIRGADVKVILLLDTVDAQYPTFSADKAQVYVRKLKLKLRGTKHEYVSVSLFYHTNHLNLYLFHAVHFTIGHSRCFVSE
jgi:hypothetical protein